MTTDQSDNTIHVMLDLETWGTEPGCDIRSIGACVFVPHTRHGGSLVHDRSLGMITPFYVACDNPVSHTWRKDRAFKINPVYPGLYYAYDLKRDQRTVDWWNDPERAEAAKAFENPFPLDHA